MLAVAVSDCEVATMQVLEDPANFFVIDLCSTVSEAAGVSSLVQTMACFFLGSCYMSLREDTSGKKTPKRPSGSADPSSRMTQAKLLGMIDSKVGLSRFTEILRKPLAGPRSGHLLSAPHSVNPRDVFLTRWFKGHYEKLIDSIRNGILEHYSTGDSASDKDSPQQQIINLLNQRVQELESELLNERSRAAAGSGPATNHGRAIAAPTMVANQASDKEGEVAALQQQLAALQQQLSGKDKLLAEFSQRKSELENELEELCMQISAAEAARDENAKTVVELRTSFQDVQDKAHRREAELQTQIFNLQNQSHGDAVSQSMHDGNDSLQTEVNTLKIDNETLRRMIVSLEESLAKFASVDTKSLHDSSQQQLQAMSESFAELETRFRAYVGENEDNWKRVLNDTLHFVDTVGINSVRDTIVQFASDANVTGNMASVVKSVQLAFGACEDDIRDAANQCSDVAQGLQIYYLAGDEGTIDRINDCFVKIQQRLEVQNEKIQQAADAEGELRHAEAMIASLQEELSTVRSENEALHAANHSQVPESNGHALLQQAQSELETLRTKYATEKSRWDDETGRILQKMLDLERQRDENMNAIDNLQTELKSKSQDSEGGNDEVITALRNRVKKQSDDNAAQKEKHDAYVALTKTKLKEAAEALVAMDNEKAKLREENAKLSGDITKMDEVCKNLYSMNQALNEEHNDLQKKFGAVKAESDDKSKALEFAAANVKEMQHRLAESPRLTAEKSTHPQVEQLQAEVSRLIAELEEQTRLFSVERVTAASLNSQLDQLIAEKDAIVLEHERVVSGLQAQVRELSVGHDGRINAETTKSTTLTLQLEALENECAQLKATKELADVEIARLQSTLLFTENEKRTSDIDKINLAEQVAALVNERNKLEAEIGQAQDSLSTAHTRMAELQMEVDRLGHDLHGASKNSYSMKSENDSLLNEINELNSKLATASHQFSSLEDEMEHLNQSLSMKSFEISAKSTELENLTVEFAEAQQTIARLEARLTEAKAAKDRALDVNDAIKAQSMEVDRLNDKV
jgi:chromosome segregation ATPase